jgi:DUF4097 and DUF4098 domain-containing protein YvlB
MSRNERWEVGERPSLDIRMPVGTVEVYTGDAGILQLTIDAGDLDDFDIFKTGERISVRHPSKWGRRGRSTRLVAHVPVDTDVALSSTSGDVRLSGRLGTVRVHTASGKIEVGDAGRVEITTASGDVSCGYVSGDADVSAISGACTLHRIGGRLNATLTSGDMRLELCDGDMTIVSTSGDVRVACCGGNDISVRSMSGDVRVGLPSGIRVEADISTLSGRAVLPDAVASGDHAERRQVRLQLKTVSGDIRVERTT